MSPRSYTAPTSLLPFDEVREGEERAHRVFRVRSDQVRSRQKGRDVLVDRVLAPDWVNVVALFEEAGAQQLLCVRQWRFGSRSFSLEIPAGLVDPGEAPRAAALRELREETGFAPRAGTPVLDLGPTSPNAAFMDNVMHTFFVPQAVEVGAQRLDDNEEVEVVTMPVSDVDARVADGTFVNAMVIVALYRWRLRQAL